MGKRNFFSVETSLLLMFHEYVVSSREATSGESSSEECCKTLSPSETPAKEMVGGVRAKTSTLNSSSVEPPLFVALIVIKYLPISVVEKCSRESVPNRFPWSSIHSKVASFKFS